jgi:hypothetical protein
MESLPRLCRFFSHQPYLYFPGTETEQELANFSFLVKLTKFRLKDSLKTQTKSQACNHKPHAQPNKYPARQYSAQCFLSTTCI